MSEGFRMHVFVCTNEREEGHTRGSCGRKGSLEKMTMLKRAARKAGLEDVRVNKSGCLDKCENGPSCVVYPEGTWYTLPDEETGITSILNHIKGGSPSQKNLMVDE